MSVNIKIKKFRDYRDIDIELSNFLIFCGDNGNGKTQLVKLLDGIDSFIRNGPYRRNDFDNDQGEGMYQKLLGIVSPKVQTEKSITISKTDFAYGYFLKQTNDRLNNSKMRILSNVFGESVNDDIVLDGLSINMTELPEVTIDLKQYEVSHERNLRAHINDSIDQINDKLKNDRYQRYEYRIGVSIEGDNQSEFIIRVPSKLEEVAISNTVLGVIEHEVFNVLYNHNFEAQNNDTLYLPPSREVYMRDNKYFIQNRSQDNNIRIEETKSIYTKNVKNIYSDDPSIESFVLRLNDARASFKDVDNEMRILNYFEKQLLKAKIVSESDNLFYKCGDQKINPLVGSSLLNEYSALDLIIKSEPNLRRLIIEEPESHLSVTNTFKMVQFLSELFINDYRIWITTHNTIIGDGINSIITLSKLDETERRGLINKHELNPALLDITKTKFEEVNAYFLNNSTVKKLEKNDYGIEFTLFENQLNSFVDFVADVQNVYDDEIETGELENG